MSVKLYMMEGDPPLVPIAGGINDTRILPLAPFASNHHLTHYCRIKGASVDFKSTVERPELTMITCGVCCMVSECSIIYLFIYTMVSGYGWIYI